MVVKVGNVEFPDSIWDEIKKLRENNPLNNMEPLEVMRRLESWREVDLRYIDESTLSGRLLETIPVVGISSSLLTDNFVYRVRPQQKGSFFENVSDIWCPPNEVINKLGRANGINQPILYCSLDNQSPIFECHIRPGDWFTFTVYKVKDGEGLQVTNVVNSTTPTDLNEKGLINLNIINYFIYNEFTKHVGIETEYLYKISNRLCIDIFDIPNCDGFIYPSIANQIKGYNVAIKPDSCKKIEFKELIVCELKEEFVQEKGFQVNVLRKCNKIQSDRLIYD